MNIKKSEQLSVENNAKLVVQKLRGKPEWLSNEDWNQLCNHITDNGYNECSHTNNQCIFACRPFKYDASVIQCWYHKLKYAVSSLEKCPYSNDYK